MRLPKPGCQRKAPLVRYSPKVLDLRLPATIDKRMPPGRERAIDWNQLSSLRVKAKYVAEGIYAGAHRSRRRGSGVEFGGYRSYSPGDDLRWLDRHALMRHGRFLIREFEADTDQALWLAIDASRSMAFKGSGAPCSKFAYASLLSTALARLTVASGDWVALAWLGGSDALALNPGGGRDAFERIVAAVEQVKPTTDLSEDPAAVNRALARVGQLARRGSIIVLFSDLIDLPASAESSILSLVSRKRTVVVVRILDELELSFPFSGSIELCSTEGLLRVQTDASAARAPYLQALRANTERWSEALRSRGAEFVPLSTADNPTEAIRQILRVAGGGL